MRHCSFFSEVDDEPSVIYYPPAISRREPKWMGQFGGPFSNVDDAVGEPVHEIYASLHNSSRRLSTIGTRSLLEHVMLSKISDQGTFKKNVAAFQNAGFLSEKHAQFLTTVIDAGNASIHRSWKPTREQLSTIMDITESILEAVYVLHPSAEKLATGIPARK